MRPGGPLADCMEIGGEANARSRQQEALKLGFGFVVCVQLRFPCSPVFVVMAVRLSAAPYCHSVIMFVQL